ncbi:MAG: B12-binding domain-containing radical SAM protein [Candidatus Helarchaeota archaeon]
MKDIVFLNLEFPINYNSVHVLEVLAPSLGQLSLAAVVRDKGYNPNLIDLSLLKIKKQNYIEILSEIDNLCYIGFTAHTVQYNAMLEHAKEIKDIFHDIKIIAGGPHPSLLPESVIFKDSPIDYVILNEGEISLPKLLNEIENGDVDYKTEGICWFANGKIHINKAIPILDLDQIPFPAYDIAPMEEYYNLFRKYAKKFDYESINFRIPMEASRGCPGKCTFCCTRIILHNKFRNKSPERIINEIKYLYNLYPNIMNSNKVGISFVDNNFTTNKKMVKEFCYLKNLNDINVKWAILARATDLTDELIKTLSQSNLSGIYIGGESGDLDGLKHMKKGYNGPNDTIKAVNLCLKYSIKNVVVSFFVGAPWENYSNVVSTLNFAYNLHLLSPKHVQIIIYKFTPYPGTELWDEIFTTKVDPANFDFKQFDLGLKNGLVYKHPDIDPKILDNLIILFNSLLLIETIKIKVDAKISVKKIENYLILLKKWLNSCDKNFKINVKFLIEDNKNNFIDYLNEIKKDVIKKIDNYSQN